jgi:hypothetical protein
MFESNKTKQEFLHPFQTLYLSCQQHSTIVSQVHNFHPYRFNYQSIHHPVHIPITVRYEHLDI